MKNNDNIKQELLKLPIENQEVINDSNWEKITEEIGKIYFLTEDEISKLQTEVGITILGFGNFDLFVSNIESNIDLTNEESKKIAEEVLEKIFTPVAEKIKSSIVNKVDLNSVGWDKSIDFIVSGGDYSVFLDK